MQSAGAEGQRHRDPGRPRGERTRHRRRHVRAGCSSEGATRSLGRDERKYRSPSSRHALLNDREGIDWLPAVLTFWHCAPITSDSGRCSTSRNSRPPSDESALAAARREHLRRGLGRQARGFAAGLPRASIPCRVARLAIAEWERIAPLLEGAGQRTLVALEDAYRDGVPDRSPPRTGRARTAGRCWRPQADAGCRGAGGNLSAGTFWSGRRPRSIW